MKGIRIALAAVTLSSMITGSALAGGRAQVTILSAPKDVVAGKTFEVSFAVKPEWPMARRSIEPMVKAACGDREVTLTAVPLKATGQYKASFALPAAGEWTITVDSRYCETRMKALVLKAAEGKSTQS